jgi:MFS family permease
MAERSTASPSGTGKVQEEVAPQSKLWTKRYVLVCLAGFLAYTSYVPLMPVLPLYIDEMGGSAIIVGLSVAAFSGPSFILRPFVGRLTDTWMAPAVFCVGGLLVGIAGLGLMIPIIATLFLAEIIHGTGWAAINTAGNAMVARVAPPDQRGAASSYYQVSIGISSSFLPFFALKLADKVDYWVVFLIAGLAGFSGAFVATRLVPLIPKLELPQRTQSFWATLIDKGALLPSGLLFLFMMTTPATAAFLPLYAKGMGISTGDIAILFLVLGAIGLVAQVALARLSDRLGRATASAIGLTGTFIGLFMLCQAHDVGMLIAGMIVMRMASAVMLPALMAMTMDRSSPTSRGAAMATYSLSFQMGTFFSALIGGFFVDLAGYRAFYYASLVPILMAAAVLVWRRAAMSLVYQAPA